MKNVFRGFSTYSSKKFIQPNIYARHISKVSSFPTYSFFEGWRVKPHFCQYDQDTTHNTDFIDEYKKHGSWGMLTSIDVSDCDPETIRSKEYIEKFIIEFCDLVDMKRFGQPFIQHFGPTKEVEGYSMFQFIETSCLSGHFANNTNKAYIDLFSCKPYDPKIAAKFTAEKFKSNKFEYSILLRK